MVVAELQGLLRGVPPGLWLASLLYAGALYHDRLADAQTPAWPVMLAMVLVCVSVVLAPIDPLVIESYYVWAEYNFIGAAEWLFLVAIPNVAGVVLGFAFMMVVGLGFATPAFVLTDWGGQDDGTTTQYRRSSRSRSSSRSKTGSERVSSSDVSKNDGVTYNSKGELVEEE